MITLHKSTSTKENLFKNNGLGILKDCISAEVTEEINGEFALELEYPKGARLFNEIKEEMIIVCDCGYDEEQAFRIKKIELTLTSKKIYAIHIFYDLADNFLEDTYPQNLDANSASNWILSHTQYEHEFEISSNISKSATARYVRKNPVEALISADNSFINVWGGELVRNNYKIEIVEKRQGQAKKKHIRYRKNLTGITYTTDFSTVVTRAMPIGYDGLLLPEKYVDSDLIDNYSHPIINTLDYSSDIKLKEDDDDEEGYETLEECYEEMRSRVKEEYENGLDKPSVSSKIDFVELSKTVEYKNYTLIETLLIGDTINVYLEEYNIDVDQRIIKTKYDCLLKKYTSYELGTPKANYVSNSTSKITKIQEILPNLLEQAKENATSQITQALGGYIYKTQNELYIMDTDDVNTAKKVWRWNLNGLGYSENGINGTYKLALTQDGQFVADFITSGTMSVDRIEGLSNTLKEFAEITIEHNKITQIVSNTVDVTREKTTDSEVSEISLENCMAGKLRKLQIYGSEVFGNKEAEVTGTKKEAYVDESGIYNGTSSTDYICKVYEVTENKQYKITQNSGAIYQISQFGTDPTTYEGEENLTANETTIIDETDEETERTIKANYPYLVITCYYDEYDVAVDSIAVLEIEFSKIQICSRNLMEDVEKLTINNYQMNVTCTDTSNATDYEKSYKLITRYSEGATGIYHLLKIESNTTYKFAINSEEDFKIWIGLFSQHPFEFDSNNSNIIATRYLGFRQYSSDGWFNDNNREITFTTGENDCYLLFFSQYTAYVSKFELRKSVEIIELDIPNSLKSLEKQSVDEETNETITETVYDEFVYDVSSETLAKVIRRIGTDDDGNLYLLDEETIESIDIDEIILNEGTNDIQLVDNTAYIYAKYIIENEYTKNFVTEVEMNATFEMLANSIKLSVQQSDIIAALNLAIEDGQGIVTITGNQVSIESDYFKLTADGKIEATEGKIAGLTMENTGGLTDFYKEQTTDDGDTYRSGLWIPKNALEVPFLYAGLNMSESGGSKFDANAYITHDGKIYAKWFQVNGENGYFYVCYDSGRTAIDINRYGMNFYVDDSSNGFYGFMGCIDSYMEIRICDTLGFQMYDWLHGNSSQFYTMMYALRYNPNSSGNEKYRHLFGFNGNIYCWGTGADSVNNTIKIQGLEVATNGSDQRLKENIKDSSLDSLEEINKISIRQFDWRTDKGLRQGGNHVNFGFIAQEVQKIDETLVHYDEEFDTYQMECLNLIGLSYKAIQELYKKVINLEKNK